jgi:hypothetical protein
MRFRTMICTATDGSADEWVVCPGAPQKARRGLASLCDKLWKQNMIIAHIRAALRAAAVAAMAFLAYPIWAAEAELADAPAPIEDFRIAVDGSLLILPVRLGETDYSFALDTGSDEVVVDTSLKPLLGERRWITKIPGKPVFYESFDAPDAYVGKLSLRAASTVLCTDLRTPFGGENGIDGLIGMSFLQRFVVRLDPDEGKLLFFTAASELDGQRINLASRGRLQYVRGTVPGYAPLEFLVDTGCSGHGSVAVSESVFGDLERARLLTRFGAGTNIQLSGCADAPFGELSSLRFGSFDHTNLICSCRKDQEANLLGLNLLMSYIVTFDFPRGAMYVKPVRRGSRFADRDLAGIYIKRSEGDVIVTGLDPLGRAARGGVESGDRLLKVNGRRVAAMRMDSIVRMFCEYGATLRVEVSRRGRSVLTSFTLHERR